MSMDIFGLRLSSHDKLDESVHLRGLVDLSNFSNVGKESLRAMGLSNRTINAINTEKQRYYNENFYDPNNPAHQPRSGGNSSGSGQVTPNNSRFMKNYESRLSNVAPTVSKVLRAPDEYPWEIHVGHMQFASSIKIEGKPFDDQLAVQNCRFRWVSIRSDANDLPISLDDNINFKPFTETQLSFRTEAIVGALDTSVIDELVKYLNFEDLSKLPFPQLYKKVMHKLEKRQKMKLKIQKARKAKIEKLKNEKRNSKLKKRKKNKDNNNDNNNKTSKSKEIKPDPSKMNDKQLQEIYGDADVRRLSLSSEDSPEMGKNNNNNNINPTGNPRMHESNVSGSTESDLVDLDIFIEGVLDGVVPVDDEKEDEDDDDDSHNGRLNLDKNGLNINNSKGDFGDVSDFDDGGDTPKGGGGGGRREITPRDGGKQINSMQRERSMSSLRDSNKKDEPEMKLIVYSNLDRAEFELSNNGKKIISGKSECQQGLFQWTQERINFHFFSKEFQLFESPIGKYNEHDVITRFCKDNITKRFWSEIIHEQTDGALELSHPPSFNTIRERIDNNLPLSSSSSTTGNRKQIKSTSKETINVSNKMANTNGSTGTSTTTSVSSVVKMNSSGSGSGSSSGNSSSSSLKHGGGGLRNKFHKKKKDKKNKKSKIAKIDSIDSGHEFSIKIHDDSHFSPPALDTGDTPADNNDTNSTNNINNTNSVNENVNTGDNGGSKNDSSVDKNSKRNSKSSNVVNASRVSDAATSAIVSKINEKLLSLEDNLSNSDTKFLELTQENEKLTANNKLYFDFLKHMLAENRAMQVKILQLTSDLAMSRDDMARFVEQTTTDKIRIVEHQQTLVEDNLGLAEKVRKYKNKVKELENQLVKNSKNGKK